MGRIDPAVIDAVMGEVQAALAATARRPVVIGICGAQGSGKSTLAGEVAEACTSEGLSCAVLSIDDLYRTRAEREALARTVHPLFATRGVPGTHDVARGMALLDALERGEAAPLPRFDKARDERAPVEEWPRAPEHCEVLLFEGWCVGARPQREGALAAPVNALEAEEDREGIWRSHANAELGAGYADLFARIDRLVLLAAPGFEVVRQWRGEQEAELALANPDALGVMDEAAIARFVAHYERLTRHILAEMPGRADLVIHLDEARRTLGIERKA